MFIFVFEDVLTDYTSGMAVIAAESLRQAQELAHAEFGGRFDTLEQFLEDDDGEGFRRETACYPTQGVSAGVLHYVYGGG